jgi:hypothetical protein
MYRIFRWAGPVVLAASLAAARANEPKPLGDRPESAAQRYQALRNELVTSDQKFSEEYRAAKTDEDKEKATATSLDRRASIARKVMAIAEENPNDLATVDAVILAFQTTRLGPEKQKALDLILKDHVTSDKLAAICPSLAFMTPDGDKALRVILEKNPHRNVKGNACFSLGRVLKGRADGGADADRNRKEADQLFERTAKEFADVKRLGWRTEKRLGEAAESELFEIRRLAVGMAAPDLEGEDTDGKAFKLSDYRGKVVLLDFWGNW